MQEGNVTIALNTSRKVFFSSFVRLSFVLHAARRRCASPLCVKALQMSRLSLCTERWSSWWGRWAWVLTALGGWPWWSKGLLHDCDEFSRLTIKVTPFQEHECQIAEDPVRPSPQLKRSEQASLYMLFWFCKKKNIYKQSTNNVQILLHWALKEYGCA